ncbi:hypothetical protein AUEXF2481DRAFT_6958 [Aureobasidium subglaciale EXF-2481]|uniref:SET domain-containing protein n=1 Tax=Aureobasidium subglaciale (strain EXF-2481) TaxID=1043005 RepID=A0A074Z318_AURSE|nr:uncharacterized protein AUEXF2481DRAFT_6958 [Aureobasidium subglaciale EXF-2481]KEQ93451.1 hypothetical protein AUEXF2481DRAFT_6958 [Aureobasidium subglaciale EXF-2481]
MLGNADDLEYYMLVLDGHLDDMDEDHESLTESWLGRARIYERPEDYRDYLNPRPSEAKDKKRRQNPFANVKPQAGARATTLTGKSFSISHSHGDTIPKVKSESITVQARVTSWKAPKIEVPTYSHYTRIRNNVLGTNTRQLQVWPYFGEDIDDDGTIRERYDVIVEDRPRKVLISQQASSYGPYFEAFLEEIECPMDCVLKYLLEATEGPDGLFSRLTSFSDELELIHDVLSAKDEFCKDDFNRKSARWVSVASIIPEIDDEILWRAALACHTFWTMTDFSPWQIARKYAEFPDNDMIEGLVSIETGKSYDSIACSICHIHDCPNHGTIHERPNGREDSEDDADSVDALDVDFPPRVNFKQLATYPFDRESSEEIYRTQPKKSLAWWMNEANSVTWDHSRRDQTIDSQRMGNKIRFINHATRPGLRNVYPKIKLCNLAHRIGMYASRDIETGEELFFNYGGSYHDKLYGEEEESRNRNTKAKDKGKGKGKAVMTQIRPSRKTYQAEPRVVIEVPRRVTNDASYAEVNEDDDSEDERPTKRMRTKRPRSPSVKSESASPKRMKFIPLEEPSHREPTTTRSAARKTETRSHRSSRAPTAGSSNLKAAVKSARSSKPSGRESRSVTIKSEDENELELIRRSSRPRKESRKLRGDN